VTVDQSYLPTWIGAMERLFVGVSRSRSPMTALRARKGSAVTLKVINVGISPTVDRRSAPWRWLRLFAVAGALSLSACGDEDDLATLTARLSDPKAGTRIRAANRLGRLGPGAAPASRELGVALGDRDRQVRIEAARALAKIGPGAVAAVPALVVGLKDESGFVRSASARALGSIGPTAAAAVPNLVEALLDPDSDHNPVGYALWKIRPPPSVPTIEALVKVLKEEENRFAASALGDMGQGAVSAVPALIEVVSNSDFDEWAREGAAAALGDIGIGTPEVISALEAAARDDVSLAVEALEKLQPARR
jgi:HEAT repeat protein